MPPGLPVENRAQPATRSPAELSAAAAEHGVTLAQAGNVPPVSSAPEGSPYARHLPGLDGLRGLAVLGVMASHLFQGNATGTLQLSIAAVLGFGANSVDLFFVLSGFLITGILYDSLGDPRFFRKFYARRALRIFPLYYGVLLVYGVAALIHRQGFHGQLLSLALYLQNTHLIAAPIGLYNGVPLLPLQHFWSLAVEEQFYLVWPVVVFLVRRRRPLLVAAAVLMLLGPLLRTAYFFHGGTWLDVNTNTACHADTLLMGGALALLLRGSTRTHDVALRLAGWLVAAGALLELALVHISHVRTAAPWPQLCAALQFSAIAVLSTGLVGLAVQSGPVQRALSVRPLRWVGRYSYGLYVLHYILFVSMRARVTPVLRHLTRSHGLTVLLYGLLCAALSLVAAYASFELYERHFLRLKRYFDYRPHPNTVR